MKNTGKKLELAQKAEKLALLNTLEKERKQLKNEILEAKKILKLDIELCKAFNLPKKAMNAFKQEFNAKLKSIEKQYFSMTNELNKLMGVDSYAYAMVS